LRNLAEEEEWMLRLRVRIGSLDGLRCGMGLRAMRLWTTVQPEMTALVLRFAS